MLHIYIHKDTEMRFPYSSVYIHVRVHLSEMLLTLEVGRAPHSALRCHPCRVASAVGPKSTAQSS